MQAAFRRGVRYTQMDDRRWPVSLLAVLWWAVPFSAHCGPERVCDVLAANGAAILVDVMMGEDVPARPFDVSVC